MFDILTVPAASPAAQDLSSQSNLADLVDAAVTAFGDWDTTSAACNACTGTAYEVETARLAKRAAYHRYNRRVDALVEATNWKVAVDPGIRYLHASNAAWEHALDNPEDYNGL